MVDEVFVVGTGPSLLSLTKEEVDYINSKPCISVNKYIMFRDVIGIKPKHHVLLDLNDQTDSVLKGTIRGIKGLDKLNWITTKQHLDLIKSLDSKIESRVKFTLVSIDRERHVFADKFDPSIRLFWCSGLGSAINAIHILYPNSTVKILGMDGGPNTHFWAEDLVKNPNKYTDSIYKKHRYYKPLESISDSAKNHNSTNMFKWGLPIILRHFNKKDIGVYNCNRTSAYVINGQMEYKEVI